MARYNRITRREFVSEVNNLCEKGFSRSIFLLLNAEQRIPSPIAMKSPLPTHRRGDHFYMSVLDIINAFLGSRDEVRIKYEAVCSTDERHADFFETRNAYKNQVPGSRCPVCGAIMKKGDMTGVE